MTDAPGALSPLDETGINAAVEEALAAFAAAGTLAELKEARLAHTGDASPLTLANRLEVDGGAVTVTRTVGTVREVLSAPLPALVSVTDQANEPRYPNFAAMRAAKKKPIDFWDASELGLQVAEPAVAVVDDEARPAREAGIIRTDAGEAGRELAAWLVENKFV